MSAGKFRIIAHVETSDGTRSLELQGREAWTVRELVKAGQRGITSHTYPGVRLAAHIFNLRQIGAFDISTRHEAHDGPFRGLHGRYTLHNAVRIERPEDEGEAA